MNCEKIYISGRYRNTVTSLSRIIMWHLKQSKHNFRILLDNPNQSASCKLIMFKEIINTDIPLRFYLGVQRTFISSCLIIILSILNIVFSIYFVQELNLDVSGIALGTLLSAYITVIIFLF